MKIVIKIGTGSVLAESGTALHPAMTGIAAEIASLKHDGHDIILVCSGAVGMGRQVLRTLGADSTANTLPDKQMLSGIGQPALLMAWNSLLAMHGLAGSQVLLTRAELAQKSPKQKLLDDLEACHANQNVIAIVNENDAIATDEFGFSDNDELASILARVIHADRLILLTGTDGLYTQDPKINKNAQRIDVLHAHDARPALTGGSPEGRGGVESKINSSFAAAAAGIPTIIALAKRVGVIEDSLSTKPRGTLILPPP